MALVSLCNCSLIGFLDTGHTLGAIVRRGDLVKKRFVHRGQDIHPMHLHGHHLLVLEHNGARPRGGSWWTDSLNLAPGDVVDVGSRADNPGIWMDHCQRFDHATKGMTTPFVVGRDSVNHPD
jgi:FtsP/CotA-like multicopper oxidase with cupredoxin domain